MEEDAETTMSPTKENVFTNELLKQKRTKKKYNLFRKSDYYNLLEEVKQASSPGKRGKSSRDYYRLSK